MKEGIWVRLSKWLAMPAVIVLCLLCMPGAVSGAEPTTVRILAPSEPVEAGEEFNIEIGVEPGAPIAGMQFDLSFDASLFTVVRVEEGSLLRQGGATTFFNPGTVYNQAGSITGVFGAVTSPGMAVSAPGAFAMIVLKARQHSESCPLSLSNVIVGDIAGNALPVSVDSEGSQTPGGDRQVFQWWVLSVILGVAVVLIALTVAGVLLRRRQMLRDLEGI
ncbi:MAG: cohesin domain-containing protein [Dehalococcoidia bacterium]|nr:cohesin domain-containing protein [Dehalococcoidia bacterium]